jgi:signal transduction histidine kinase
MGRRETVLTTRRLVIASVAFGLFVLFDIFLFSWLISSSLSQRELEQALLETRQEAEPLAEALREQAAEHEGDIWVVMSVATETWTYIDDVLNQREIVRKIEIRDRDGRVAFGPYWSRDELEAAGDLVPRVELPESLELPAAGEPGPVPPAGIAEEVEVPIGEFGTLVVGLDNEELQKRIGVLRRDLTRQALVIGLLTVTLLAASFVAVWKLFQRARRSEEQALEAERLAYLGTLASGLAHEIRNPLNSLNLNMQMLEEEAREGRPGGSRRLLSITRSELARLERLATDFLTYARPQPLELREVPAVELLERVLGVLAGEIQKRGAEVKIEDRSRGARVRVDPQQINQLLLNLTQNALAAGEAGPRPAAVRLAARCRDERVALEVTDNGPGIPPEERERIFDLFYSTKKGGTGLGLAIVQSIARAHGAELEVESAPGRGTTVRLLLPALVAAAAYDREALTSPRPPLPAGPLPARRV